MFVLDVGSGHRPLPQADVLADRYLENRERADDFVVDRPAVLCDIEHLPFKDDAFDFVNASQVVEHTDNPDDAIAELERVATSGQVDTPAFVNENIMFGRNFHNWTMLVPSLKGRPRFVEATHPDRERFKSVFSSSRTLRAIFYAIDSIFRIIICRYYWGEGRQIHRRIRHANTDTTLKKLKIYVDTTIGELGQVLTNRLIYALNSRFT